MSDPTPDLEASVEAAWKQYRAALAEAFDQLSAEGSIQIELEIGGDAGGSAPYVQALRLADCFVLEAVSNRYLDETWRLRKNARRRLRGLGFAKPSDEMPNYWLTVPLDHVDEAAAIAVAALREGYSVVHPSFLTNSGFEWTGEDTPAPGEPAPDKPPTVYPRNREHLDELIDQTLSEMLGATPQRDSDGDVPIPAGTSVIFVRSHEETPLIRLFALLATHVGETEAAIHEVHALNRDVESVKFVLYKDAVIASAEVLAWPFAPTQLQSLLAHMRHVVQEHDCELARRLGGRVFLDRSGETRVRPTGAHDQEHDDIHPVMLSILQLDPERPGSLRPKDAAKLCGYDSDLLLELIHWNEEQEIAWREARDQTDDVEEAQACEHERAHAERTVRLLRKALRKVLLR